MPRASAAPAVLVVVWLGIPCPPAGAQAPAPPAGRGEPAPPSPPKAERHALANGHFLLEGEGGRFTSLRVDPAGRGAWSRDLLVDFGLGEPGPSPLLTVRRRGDAELELDNVLMRLVAPAVDQPAAEEAIPVPADGTLAQTFVAAGGPLARVEVRLARLQAPDAGVVLRVRRDGPAGEVLAEQRVRGPAGDGWVATPLPDLPPGTYCVEAAEPAGGAAWWSSRGDRYAGGVAWRSGHESPGHDFTLRAAVVQRVPARWTLSLSGRHLLSRVEVLPTLGDPRPAVQLTTTWARDGYALDHPDIAFSRFVTADGTHLPVSQFKRRAERAATAPCAFLHLAGRGAFDLRLHFTRRPAAVRWTMSADAMTFHPSQSDLALEVLPHADWVTDGTPRFSTGETGFDRLLNEFLWDFAFSEASAAGPERRAWMNTALDWTDHPFRARERRILLDTRPGPDGRIDVPTPGDAAGPRLDAGAQFIIGAYIYYCWTRDAAFLDEIRPRLRAAMAWQLAGLGGERGLIEGTGPGRQGRPGGVGGAYWTGLPFGHLSAWENIHFYESLRCLAELERHGKNPARADELLALRRRVRERYNETFWRADRSRYVGCLDADGRERDYGFVFLNLEAACHRLADDGRIRAIYRWLETEPTHEGAPDVFTRWRFAPRTTTVHNPPPAEDPEGKKAWRAAGWNGAPWGDDWRNGGAVLGASFFDLLARARTFGADNAFARFRTILDRYAEADRLAGGGPRVRGETVAGPGEPGQIGTDLGFPESALVPSAFLYCFLGASVDIEGLKVRPNLPAALGRGATVEGLAYTGRYFTMKVTADQVEFAWPQSGLVKRVTQKVPPGGYVLVTPDFQIRGVEAAKSGP